MKRAVLVAIIGAVVLALSGCGSTTTYPDTFKEVVPSTWTDVSHTGSVKNSCNTGPDCGAVSHTYSFTTTSQQAAVDFLHQLQTRQCAGQQQGNGISADCSNGLHLAVSFTTNTASVTVTKNG